MELAEITGKEISDVLFLFCFCRHCLTDCHFLLHCKVIGRSWLGCILVFICSKLNDDNINMGLKEFGYNGVGEFVWLRVVLNACETWRE
jgi:hypothetical protein